jgi:hypothetical protein
MGKWLIFLTGILFLFSCSKTSDTTSLDVDPPVVMITYPGDFELLNSRQFTVRVTATDNGAVEQVKLYVNGVENQTATSEPFTFPLSVDSTVNQITLLAEAVDKNHNTGISRLVSVYFPDLSDREPPVVAILSPAAWSEVTGDTLLVKISARDNQGLRRLVCFFNGDSVQTLREAPYLWKLPIANYSGNATLMVEAWDWSGNRTVSDAITVSINTPDVTSPEVQILRPADWETVSGDVPIRLAVSDDRGVAQVEILWNGVPLDTLTAAPWEATLHSTTYPNGNYTLMARAWDTSGNSGDSRAITVVINN